MRGHCLCGTVEFEIVGNLPYLYQCHCSFCRRQSRAGSDAATIVNADQLKWTAGQATVRSWTKDTGFRSDFCSLCGSPVPNPLRNKPYFRVPVGLLDDTVETAIAIHLHMGSKAVWESLPTHGTWYEELPHLEQLLKELNEPSGGTWLVPAAPSNYAAT